MDGKCDRSGTFSRDLAQLGRKMILVRREESKGVEEEMGGITERRQKGEGDERVREEKGVGTGVRRGNRE